MNRLILVTGATGFVGKAFIEQLEDSPVRIRLVLRSGSGSRIPCSSKIESVIYTDDLFAESVNWWESVCEGVDIFVSLAWYVDPKDYLHSLSNIDCLVGTFNIAKACVNSGVKRFFGIGTCFEYDLSSGYLSTQTPLNPLTLYAASKASAFQILTRIFEPENIKFVWGGLFYLYGFGDSDVRLGGYIHHQLSRGEPAELSHGLQIRDYLDVKEAASLLVQIMLSDQTGPVNICSGNGKTVREIAETIAGNYNRIDLLQFGAIKTKSVEPDIIVGILN